MYSYLNTYAQMGVMLVNKVAIAAWVMATVTPVVAMAEWVVYTIIHRHESL